MFMLQNTNLRKWELKTYQQHKGNLLQKLMYKFEFIFIYKVENSPLGANNNVKILYLI